MTIEQAQLSDTETAAYKDLRKTFLGGSSALQREIHKLVVGEQSWSAKHPAAYTLIVFGIGIVTGGFVKAILWG